MRAGHLITDEMLRNATHVIDLDRALANIMAVVGITDGGVAGIVFSGEKNHEWWIGATYSDRLEMLQKWRDAEQTLGDWAPVTRTATEMEALLLKYMARVIDVEGVAFIDEGMSYTKIEFEGDDLAYLKALEDRAREEYDL